MGIYSTRGIYESSINLDATQPEEVFEENFMEAALRHTYENTCNLNRIMQTIGIAELAEFEETGRDVVYEAADVKGFFAKIKASVMKIWQKIKGLFTKFFAKMKSFSKDDKAFVNKYRKQILAADLTDFEYKGYEFTLDVATASGIQKKFDDNAKIKKAFDFGVDDIKEYNWSKETDEAKTVFGEEISDVIEEARGVAIGSSDSFDQKEFTEELFKLFRKGEDSKQDLDDKSDEIDPYEICRFLEGSSKTKKDIEDDFRVTEKNIKKVIKKLTDAENALYKMKSVKEADEENNNDDKDDKLTDSDKSKRLKLVSTSSKIVNNCLTIMEQVEAAKMTAFNDKRKQCKAIAVKLIGRKNPNAKNESYGYNDDSFISYLDDVRLV